VGGWGQRVLAGSAVGAIAGGLFGAVLVWLLFARPQQMAPMPATLTVWPSAAPVVDERAAGDHDELFVVVSALYALDRDVDRARERLAAAGVEDPAEAIAELARRHAAAGNRQLATDLATLSDALGGKDETLLAYVATATGTPTPSPTVTQPSTSTATWTPVPTATSLPTDRPTVTATATTAPTATRRAQAAAPRPTTAPTASAEPAPTTLPLDWWDYRVSVLEPPVRLVEARVAPGELYWRLVRLEWRKPGEGGNTILYVTTLGRAGRPVWGQEVIVEHGPSERFYTEPKAGQPYGVNFPMASTLNSYLVFVGGDLPSDRVTGLGLGEHLGSTDHTSFVLIFQLTRK
jgi:hypothetical protein